MLKRLFFALILALSTIGIAAQSTPPPSTGSAAPVEITFPPPVYVLSGEAEIIGTANAEDQAFYFLEYQPLDENSFLPREGDDTDWFPATLPSRTRVIDGQLALWDTSAAPDGLYALRLTVNRNSGEDVFAVVSPLRVDNSAQETISVLDSDEDINNALLALTATAQAGGTSALPTPSGQGNTAPLLATPTAFSAGTLRAEVVVLSNLRQGDSTLFAIERGLERGTVLQVIGRSSRGNNWLLVQTEDGERGWVAPSVVRLNGDINGAPIVEPPRPPVTPTPTQPPVPNLPDAVINTVDVDRELRVGEAFQIFINYSNPGRAFLPESTLFCNVEPMNVEVAVRAGSLQPGASSTSVIPLRIDSGGGQDVRIVCKIDMNEEVAEINETNNINIKIVRLNS